MSIELKPETVRTYAEGADAAVLFLGTSLLENTATLAAVNELFGVPDKLLLIGSRDELIRSENSTAHIPVIFLTGKDDSDSVRRVLELKPDGYILKSIDRDSLLERLEEFFSNRS